VRAASPPPKPIASHVKTTLKNHQIDWQEIGITPDAQHNRKNIKIRLTVSDGLPMGAFLTKAIQIVWSPRRETDSDLSCSRSG